MSHSKDNRNTKANAPLSQTLGKEEVKTFLLSHPDLIAEDPELLNQLLPEGHDAHGTVVDIRDVAMVRLRARIARLEEERHDLIAATSANALAQEQAHKAALDILNARNFEHLIDYVTRRDGLAARLDVAAVTLCIEAEDMVSGFGVRGVRLLEHGGVDRLLQGQPQVLLCSHVQGSRSLYGVPAADQVQSEALVKLDISPAAPPGLLALGAHGSEFFSAEQESDLLRFLAGVLARTLRLWLDLPPPHRSGEF